MTLTFAHRKASQALNFFAREAGGHINKMKALKLIFFADRHHLRQHGRPVTNDEYLAMGYGPVPSGCKDLAGLSDFLDDHERQYAERFLARSGQHELASLAEVERDVFSETDLDALGFAWRHYGNLDQFQLADLTHRFPEWKQHEAKLASPAVSRLPMLYSDFLQNPLGDLDPSSRLSAKDQRLRREELDELKQIASIWT